MTLNNSDRRVIAQLEAMPLDQARREIASGIFGRVGSPNHGFASTWLAVKEAELRTAHEDEMLSMARKALVIGDASRKEKWYEKPLGILWISIVASLLVGLLLYSYFPP